MMASTLSRRDHDDAFAERQRELLEVFDPTEVLQSVQDMMGASVCTPDPALAALWGVPVPGHLQHDPSPSTGDAEGAAGSPGEATEEGSQQGGVPGVGISGCTSSVCSDGLATGSPPTALAPPTAPAPPSTTALPLSFSQRLTAALQSTVVANAPGDLAPAAGEAFRAQVRASIEAAMHEAADQAAHRENNFILPADSPAWTRRELNAHEAWWMQVDVPRAMPRASCDAERATQRSCSYLPPTCAYVVRPRECPPRPPTRALPVRLTCAALWGAHGGASMAPTHPLRPTHARLTHVSPH